MSEQQKVFASVSGALVAHVIFLMAIFVLLTTRSASKDSSGSRQRSAPEPREVTVMMSDIMETLERETAELEPHTEAKTDRKFVSAETNEEELERPDRPLFESDRNTTAASKLKPDETLPQKAGPTLVGNGSDSDLTLEDQKYNDGDIDRNPSPKSGRGEGGDSSEGRVASLEQNQIKDQEKIYTTKEASGTAISIPVETSPVAKSAAGGGDNGDEGFSAEQRQDDRNGRASKRSANAVDAEKTAMGQYKQAVRSAVAQRWHRYRAEKEGTAIWGMLKLTFRVDRNGEVQKLQITKNEANATLLDISLRAIRESDLPAMPPEVAEEAGEEGLEIRYDIITY